MSQENVKIVRAAYEAWNRRDLQACLAYLHPEVEWEENAAIFPGVDPTYIGHEGFLKRDRDHFDVWESFSIEGQEFKDAGEAVVTSLHLSGKGSRSGIDVDMRVYEVFWLRDAKVVRRRVYTDHDEALQAVGLAE